MDVCSCGWIVSTPDTLQHSFYYDSRVGVSVSVCAFLKCHFESVGQSNGLRQKDFLVLVHRPPSDIFPYHPFLFVSSCNYPHFFFLRGSIPLSEVTQQGNSFLSISLSTASCLTLPLPVCLKHCSGFIWKRRSSGNAFSFSRFFGVPALFERGKVAQSSISS